MKIDLTIQGTAEVQRLLEQLADKAIRVAAGSLYRSAEKVMTRSKDEFVPVDTGTLKNSGYVDAPEVSEDGVSVTLGYGGAAKEYAIYVHEIDKNYRVGQWKYLEQPLKEATGDIAAALKDDLTRGLSK